MLLAKTKSLLGLAQRAGKLISGEAMVKDALAKNKKIELLIMAGDTSPRVKDEFIFLAKKKGIGLEEMSSKDELGSAIGKGERAIIAIIDNSFANSLRKLREEEF